MFNFNFNRDASTVSLKKPAGPAPACYINLLNSDVLFHIFELLLILDSSHDEIPVVLSKVSSAWRILVLNAPTLWAQIRVHEPLRAGNKHTMFRRTLRRVHYFLGRSQQCPLSLDITIQTSHKRATSMYDLTHPCNPYIGGFRGCTQQLSRIISAHTPRFAEFRLRADELVSIADIEGFLPRVPMPLLTYWRVAHTASHVVLDPHPTPRDAKPRLHFLLRPAGTTAPAPATCGAHMFPNLQRVRLTSAPMDWSAFTPSNLTSLALTLLPNSARPTASALSTLLRASASTLESLDLDGCVRTSTPDSPYTPLTLPHLHTLTLGFRSARELIPFLEALHTPHLRALTLTDHHQRLRHRPGAHVPRFDRDIAALLRALAAHLPLAQLTRLTLHHLRFLPAAAHERAALSAAGFASVRNAHGAFIPEALFAFLTALTGLRTLALTGPDHVLLEALNYTPPAPSLTPGTREAGRPVPKLEALSLTTFNLFVVRNFLVFRCMAAPARAPPGAWTFSPLKTLELGVPAAWAYSPLLPLAEKVARRTVVVPIVLRPVVEAALLREAGFF